MWLSTLQYAWSFLFYCGAVLVFITAVGACKKLSQDKGKTYAHLSAAVAANAPQWKAVLANHTQPANIQQEDSSGRRERDDDSSSYETEDEMEEERRERAREREKERERQRMGEVQKERERGREEKERERRRRGEESDEPDHGVGVRRRRKRPLPAGGVQEDEEEPQPLVALKGSSGSSDEQLLDGYSTSSDTASSSSSPNPLLPTFSISSAVPSRSLHYSSASSSRASAGPVILPSADVLAYRELVRVVHSAWREGLLRSQRTLIGTLIEREKERGRLTDIAATVLARVIALYETRRRMVVDKEREGGEVDEADVVADVYSLLQAGERKEADEASGSSAIVSSIRAAAALVATSGEQEQQALQEEPESELEKQSAKGVLNLTLQRLLNLPLPPPPPPLLEPPVNQLRSLLSESAAAPLDPLPPPPVFDAVMSANRYLSDSHTARTTLTQKLCTDKPDSLTSSQPASHSLPLNSSSLSSSSSHSTPASSSTASDSVPLLHPVYTVPSLQTRYLNVELLSEMELVMYAVQRRMEQLVADHLQEWIRRDDVPSQPFTQQPQSRTQAMQQYQHAADRREAGAVIVRIPSTVSTAAFSSPHPSQRVAATPSPSLSSSSLSPGAPPPSTTTAAPPLLPPASFAAAKRLSSSESAALAAIPPTVHPPVFPLAPTPPRSRALSFADRPVTSVTSPPPAPIRQLPRKHSTTRMSTPATPHSTTHASVSYYHTTPPFTPNHNVATVPVTSSGRPLQSQSPFHSATSPSTSTVLPPRPPSSGGSPRTQRARAVGMYKRENGSPGVVYATTDAMVNGSGRVINGSSGSAKHHRSKSVVTLSGMSAASPYYARDVS